ncbi:hypothetical protein NM688_g4827 [Phlebia brevispora]|uniref:Uncharacterized protein n=1 Tax=Phlebia brevispora TaxID=194682 RepID=A0ACC1T1X7_9APHY|nr:hypothetical protein NM688_g4827 [Phlebia brevispora]
MPKAAPYPCNPTEFEWRPSTQLYACLLCPHNRQGQNIAIRPSAFKQHCDTSKHRRCIHLRNLQSSVSKDLLESSSTITPSSGSFSTPTPQVSSGVPRTSKDQDQDMDIEELTSALNLAAEEDGGSEDEDEDMWDEEFMHEWMHVLETSPTDYYEDLLAALERGDRLSTTTCRWEEELDAESPDTVFPIPGEEARLKTASTDANNPFHPWPSMALFITHLLFSSPRIHFSETQKTAVLEWAKSLGAQDVPSLYAVKTCQARITKLIGDPTERVVSKSGTIFYINDVAKAIANLQDYANPLTRCSMEDYPIDAQGRMTQVQNGQKMLLDLPDDFGSPTVRVDQEIYFIQELLQLANKRYFIPQRFFKIRGSRTGSEHEKSTTDELHALGLMVSRSSAGYQVNESERVIIPIKQFFRSFVELQANEKIRFVASSVHWESKMPHPIREKANGRMVYSVPILVFMDDVSGNISKQWNKHYVVYMSNGNMPREMIDKEFCVRFVTSSPHATPMELMDALKLSIEKADMNGVTAWDSLHHEEVLLQLYPLLFAGDNPMQAEECSHGGLNCNLFCRTCMIGGSKAYKSSNDGYESLFHCGELRDPSATAAEVLKQLDSSVKPGARTKVKNAVTASGCSDSATKEITEFLTTLGLKLRARNRALSEQEVAEELEKEMSHWLAGQRKEECINPLLGIPGVNIHMDTPTEILHTILLGAVKYFWAQSIHIIEDHNYTEIFETRLASLDTSGLKDPDLRPEYIIRYKGGLIGKHFKSLAQVMPFLIYDLVSSDLLDAWSIIGRLVVLLWHTTINNTEEYIADLTRTIEDFLNATARCSPSLLFTKPKLHFLLHLPAYIRRFGPALLFSTECYESFNHVFKLTNIYSNRQAPSRDSCRMFAAQDVVKHIATGGFWFQPDRNKWICAGDSILEYLKDNSMFAHLLGLDTREHNPIGYVELQKNDSKERSTVVWPQSLCCKDQTAVRRANEKFYLGKSVVVNNGDKACLQNFVIYKNQSQTAIGRVSEILSKFREPHEAALIAVDQMSFQETEHDVLHLPRLQFTHQTIGLKAEELLAVINVQHDCLTAKCLSNDEVPCYQEREKTGRMRTTVQHNHADEDHYIMNRYALHNHELIASVTPSGLLCKTPIVQNGPDVRRSAAERLRENLRIQKETKASRAAKAAVTVARKDPK